MPEHKSMKPVEIRAIINKAKKVKTDPAFRKISEGLVKEIQNIVDNPRLSNMPCCVEGCCVSWCCVKVVVN